MYFYVPEQVPKPDGGFANSSFSTSISASDLLATFPSPLRPPVSPPQNPAVNGSSAFSNLTVDSTPLISWQPPARGTPTYYRLRFREVYIGGSGNAVKGLYTGYLRTTATSVRVPPGMLTPGKMYVMYLSAIEKNIDVETGPFYGSFPNHEAPTLSGVLTVF
jgi:hypothetical protein